MQQESKKCQNCHKGFTIEPEDFAFYEKMKVPPPTFCPQCRFQRRLAFTNLFNLYRRPCDLCKKEVISMYQPNTSYTIYCSPCWWSDKWDPADYGQDYDFSRSFFEQYDELLHKVPLLGLSLTDVDSPHNNYAGHLKNAYLLFFADFIENCGYGFYTNSNKDTYDSSLLMQCESVYDSRNVFKANRCIGVENTVESLDCSFLRDSKNCQNCFASANLHNKKNYIFNRPYSTEEYREEMKKWDLGSYRIYQEASAKAREHWKKYPPRPRWDDLSIDSTGNYVFESKNCKECYEVTGAEDSKYLFMILQGPVRDCWDYSGWGNNAERCYEDSVVGENAADIKFCHDSGINSFDFEYCKTCLGGSHLFGCISIKKGSNMILNKQYSPEEFMALKQKIIEHMTATPYQDRGGRLYGYGEFFPIELSPHGYNETLAQNFFPLSEETIKSKSYKYQSLAKLTPGTGIASSELPDHIKDTSDDVLQKTLLCEDCGRGYRIIPAELEFLRRMNVALPRRCPFCRIDEKFQEWIKQMSLIKRKCSRCKTEFETPYREEDYSVLWCSKCYQEEVV